MPSQEPRQKKSYVWNHNAITARTQANQKTTTYILCTVNMPDLISSRQRSSCSRLRQNSSFWAWRRNLSSWTLRARMLGFTSTCRLGSTFFCGQINCPVTLTSMLGKGGWVHSTLTRSHHQRTWRLIMQACLKKHTLWPSIMPTSATKIQQHCFIDLHHKNQKTF